MKKFFCFHCQKDVKPYKFWKKMLCPKCFHFITDTDNGIYLVCDRCGANMSVDATNCPKCGSGVNEHQDLEVYNISSKQTIFNWLLRIILIFFSILISIFILYVSFYLIIIFFVLGITYYIYNMFLSKK